MHIQKFRWSRVYESSEEELTTLFKARNITAERIEADAASDPTEHRTQQESTLWCGEGSMTVRTDSTSTPLQPGDALRIPANTMYSLLPGISGYICYVSV